MICAESAAPLSSFLAPAKRGAADLKSSLWNQSSHRVYLETFERGGDSEISPEKYDRMVQTLKASDCAALESLNWRYVIFWCRECDRCYCIDRWSIQYDDSPYSSEWGTCPSGHGKILDD